jgi:hypothetical protein
VTQHPPSPTAQPPAPTPEPTQAARQPEWTVSQVQGAAQVQIVLEDGLGNAYTIASVDPDIVQWEKGRSVCRGFERGWRARRACLSLHRRRHCCFSTWPSVRRLHHPARSTISRWGTAASVRWDLNGEAYRN